MEPEIDLPIASLSARPIIVARPISWEAIEASNPVLLLSSPPSSLGEFLHSGPSSSILSLSTKPQLLHISSPLPSSSTREAFPHLGHRRTIPWRAAAPYELVMLLIFYLRQLHCA